MKPSTFLKRLCLGGIGAVEFTLEGLSSARKKLGESLQDFVDRGERLNEREDGLTRAFLAALKMKPRVPSANEVNGLIPGYDDMTVVEIIDQIKRLPMKQLETIREYEYHNFNRVRIIRHIEKELDEARIIPDYDGLSVRDVLEQLDTLSLQELASLKDYEKSHRSRATVIKAIDRRLTKAA